MTQINANFCKGKQNIIIAECLLRKYCFCSKTEMSPEKFRTHFIFYNNVLVLPLYNFLNGITSSILKIKGKQYHYILYSCKKLSIFTRLR